MAKVELQMLWVVWKEFGLAYGLDPGHDVYSDEGFDEIFHGHLDTETLLRLDSSDCPPSEEVELPDELAKVVVEWRKRAENRRSHRRISKVFKPDILNFKFVLIIRQDGSHVLATEKSTYDTGHKGIAQQYFYVMTRDERDNYTEERMWVAGGGTMEVDPKKKVVSFYDESGAFGPFDHAIVAELAHKAMAEEGYRGWKLKIHPSLRTLPYFNVCASAWRSKTKKNQ